MSFRRYHPGSLDDENDMQDKILIENLMEANGTLEKSEPATQQKLEINQLIDDIPFNVEDLSRPSIEKDDDYKNSYDMEGYDHNQSEGTDGGEF